jgi:hypothetical protein
VDERAACRPFFHMWRDAYGLAAEGYAPDELLEVPSSVWLCRCVRARVCAHAGVRVCATAWVWHVCVRVRSCART